MGTKTSSPKDATLHLSQEYDEDGMLAAHTTLASSNDSVEKSLPWKGGKVVPVIFIPGIMGTNLMNLKTKERVWVAPNVDGVFPVVKTLGLLFGSWFKSAKQRQAELDSTPGAVGVYDGGELDDAGSGLSKDEMRTRKWGSIMRSAYHPIMGEMQRQMNDIMRNGELQGEWKDRVDQEPGEWGDWENNPSLAAMGDASGLKIAADTQYEVWAAGYNWLQSNRDSAKDIIDYINNTVLPHYRGKADNVIIVTHSMGGLVARAIVACHGFSKLYGVIHGAMPATGAPASYKRVRAGFEALAEKKILGRDAADAVAVMAFASGPLELLPSHDYNDGQPWLFAKDTTSMDRILRLPENCPYEEIYKSEKWWGLVPENNNKLFDPAGIITEREENTSKWSGVGDEPPSLRSRFCEVIDGVKSFHNDIEKKYHPETFVHYAAESKSPKSYTWGTIEWGAKNLKGLDAKNAKLSDDNLDAQVVLNGLYTLEIGPGYYPGDGTVPAFSSSSPRGKPGVKGAFAHGQNSGMLNHYCKTGTFNDSAGYGHQDAYTDKAGRTQYATLYSLVRLSAQVG